MLLQDAVDPFHVNSGVGGPPYTPPDCIHEPVEVRPA
jgi:hypothetical protein